MERRWREGHLMRMRMLDVDLREGRAADRFGGERGGHEEGEGVEETEKGERNCRVEEVDVREMTG